ncbi:MAG: sigma-70 family RNA polymerase sigma factor [Novosphingobium sp.]|nr:sigma-70 family RNA polymerase sigma factor [Novosphingobium sp.]
MKPAARRGVALLVRPDRVEAALWRTFLDGRGDDARQKLFDHYQPFARRLAGAQFARRKSGTVERCDMEQLAYEALLQAIARFDPARNVPFEAFARTRIAGHIANGLATMSEAAAQFRYRQRAERDRLRSLHETSPDDGADPLAVLSRLAVTLAIGLLAEEAETIDPDTIPDGQPSAYESLVWHEMRRKIRERIEALPERERYVVGQHYRNGVSFQQIAAILGISKGRVSQIHRAALLRLREELARFR